MNIPEIQDELLRLEYPNLLPGHDPDIERYYYLRNTGQSRDALYIFESRLKPRYPEHEFRTSLLRSYRSRHPQFPKLLGLAYRSLADRSLERIRRSIEYIAEKVENYDRRDVYATIRTAEDILRLFPRERYEAAEGIERYARYARVLGFHVNSMEKAAELVRSYLTQTLSVVEDERRRRETRRRREMERERRLLVKQDWESYEWQRTHGAAPLIDFSAVVFSPADLKRIEIPPALSRLEDQALAYCVKYWNLVYDPAFERILFLYSRKYGTKHHDIYLVIRRGRVTKQRDDEILASVLSSLIRGYYYSIQGDRYLQLRWNSVKSLLNQQARPALPAPPETAEAETAGTKKAAPRTRTAKAAKAAKKRRTKKKKKRAAAAWKGRKGRKPGTAATGSVSDRLQELSGRSYDPYRELFLAGARQAVRKVLGAGKGRFFKLPERVESLVYYFLKDHYSDPYMNWAESDERKKAAELGFDLESLTPIINECYRSFQEDKKS
jgi:hypothetical protein